MIITHAQREANIAKVSELTEQLGITRFNIGGAGRGTHYIEIKDNIIYLDLSAVAHDLPSIMCMVAEQIREASFEDGQKDIQRSIKHILGFQSETIYNESHTDCTAKKR